MLKTRLLTATAFLVALPLLAQSPAPVADAARLSEDLIYAVDRTPESTFDTARDVEIVTQEEIRRANVQNLGQLLERQLGISVMNGESGTMPLVRGLGGKQVMFLIDGVKVNNATWRGNTKEYLNIFDISQIERIEIVRGVVSVLGTESLGGVVNIITKKAASDQTETLTGSLEARYATAENAYRTSLGLSGAAGNLRYHAGLSLGDANDARGGSGIGVQTGTSYQQFGGFLNAQWLVSKERTLSFAYQNTRSDNEHTPGLGTLIEGQFDPSVLQLASISYLDLTDRGWQESLKVTAYGNYQREIRDVITGTPATLRHGYEYDADRLGGLNVELGTFVGSQHLVYGIDYTTERIYSNKLGTSLVTGVATPARGNLMDGATYRTAGLYLQDRADIGRFLTVIGGARWSRYEAKGSENNAVGNIKLDTSPSNVTAALNLIGHVTPSVNVIANVIRGYRAPNLEDLSWSASKPGFFTIPGVTVTPEKVLSLEAGVKYSTSRANGSLFYFRNRFKNYIMPVPSTLNGLPFRDTNLNGVRDAGESLILQNKNVGEAAIDGFDANLAVNLTSSLAAYGNYAHLKGTNQVTGQPLTLMAPATGTLGVRWNSTAASRPWAELESRFASAQHRLSATDIANVYVGADGVPAYQTLDLRGGLTLAGRVELTAAVENMLNRKTWFIGSNRYGPGRQLVLGTRFLF